MKEIKEIKGREKNSWIACKEEGGNVHLNSYIVKTKSTGNEKCVAVTYNRCS